MLVLLVAPLGRLHAEPTFPQLTGRITDEAGLLSAADRNELDAVLAALEAKSTDQLAIVTLKSLQGYDIADYGYQLGRKWGIGQAGKNNGILLIVAPNERKVRIEVGRGLEPTMTDLMSKLIIENAILPEFRRGDFAAGIRAGVRDIKDVLLGDAEEVKQRAQRSAEPDTMSVILLIFWFCVVLFIIYAVYSSSVASQNMAAGGRRGRRGGAAPVIVPGDSGGWGGGWSGGDGGGGWSGGGGDFGGGGSSGSW